VDRTFEGHEFSINAFFGLVLFDQNGDPSGNLLERCEERCEFWGFTHVEIIAEASV